MRNGKSVSRRERHLVDRTRGKLFGRNLAGRVQRYATPCAPNWWRHVPKFKRSVNSTRVDSFSSSRMTNTDDGVSGAGRRREPRGRHHVCVLAPRRKRARSTHEFTFDMCDYRTREGGDYYHRSSPTFRIFFLQYIPRYLSLFHTNLSNRREKLLSIHRVFIVVLFSKCVLRLKYIYIYKKEREREVKFIVSYRLDSHCLGSRRAE